VKRVTLLLASLAALLILAAPTQGKVVNENTDDLPPGCDEISREVSYTVRGGLEQSEGFHGVVYTFDRHTFEVPTCAKVTVTFVNEDDVRHQFMPHGTFPAGFTLIEVDGPGRDTGTFITGSEPNSLMVHCGLPQHQQKGMKAQFLVGGGVGDVPNIPGVSGVPGEGQAQSEGLASVPASLATSILSLVAAGGLAARRRR
jgi:hypothetical protein